MAGVTVLLSWYDENPAWLSATVASAGGFADQVVALDGAYFHYPQGAARSPHGQAEAIRATASACGMGCTIVEPRTVWAGNEVEKRSAMFAVAECVTAPDDWYFVLDGDEVVTDCPGNLRDRLAQTAEDAGKVTFWQHREHTAVDERPFVLAFVEQVGLIPVLFRAQRGLHVEGNHFTYRTADGQYLWGLGGGGPHADFTDVRVEHRTLLRDVYRAKQAQDYYARRTELGLEHVP